MTWWQSIILAFIEGATEFLPVSSTGHLILASAIMGQEDEFTKAFNIIIQFGAIASVLVLYWKRFLPNWKFYQKLFVAFLPAAVIGLLVKDHIDLILGSVQVVAWALIIGGVILIYSDRFFKDGERGSTTLDEFSWQNCLKLGLIQCFAFIPGVSRSGATIIGGLSLGLSRKEAAEFSFFLAVPTLAGATLIKSLKIFPTLQQDQWGILALGSVFSFLFALIAIHFFVSLVSKFGYKYFGVYRILLGVLILAVSFGGYL